jgi:hypothetical protein
LDEDFGPCDPSSDIQYDGMTAVFTATARDLAPGVHTLKLSIADTTDADDDSSVFIGTIRVNVLRSSPAVYCWSRAPGNAAIAASRCGPGGHSR